MEGDYNSQAQESEFDTIARYRGAAQNKMGALLAQHRHGNIHHGGKDEDNKGLEQGKVQDLSLSDKNDLQSGVSEQLHNSSDEAKERVFQANDRTYDAINEAKEAVKKKLEEGRANQATKDENDTSTDDSTYAAINKAKEELKDKFDTVTDKSGGSDPGEETYNQAKDKTSQVTDAVGKKYEETRDSAGQALESTKEKTHETVASTGNADGNEGKGAIQSATEKLTQVTQAIKEAIAGKGDGSPSA